VLPTNCQEQRLGFLDLLCSRGAAYTGKRWYKQAVPKFRACPGCCSYSI